MGRTIFLSLGMEANSDYYPEINPVILQNSLNHIASMASQTDCKLVMRDHPVATDMIKAHFENKPQNLKILPANAALKAALDDHKVNIAFLLGGRQDVLKDGAEIYANHQDVMLLPLQHTGGAAQMFATNLARTRDQHYLVSHYGHEDLGFTLICRAILNVGTRPNNPPPALKL